jgi:hypothetical protein
MIPGEFSKISSAIEFVPGPKRVHFWKDDPTANTSTKTFSLLLHGIEM